MIKEIKRGITDFLVRLDVFVMRNIFSIDVDDRPIGIWGEDQAGDVRDCDDEIERKRYFEILEERKKNQ